jgi:hypothetical protein
MAGAIATSQIEAVREAALGFAFSPNPAVSSAALVAVSQQRGGLVSSKVVDRLVRMRPWFSETRRTDIDTAIRALRPKAAPPVPVKRWEIRGVLASLCDGAGAQSLFALAKQGRRFALACLLVKSEVGVQDAWVRDDMTKAEALIAQIVAGAEAAYAAPRFARIGAFLETRRKWVWIRTRGRPPALSHNRATMLGR